MKTRVIDVTKVKCKYEDKCKDYKVRQYAGQSPSRCKYCKNNKYAKKLEKPNKSYFKSFNDDFNVMIGWFISSVALILSVVVVVLYCCFL